MGEERWGTNGNGNEHKELAVGEQSAKVKGDTLTSVFGDSTRHGPGPNEANAAATVAITAHQNTLTLTLFRPLIWFDHHHRLCLYFSLSLSLSLSIAAEFNLNSNLIFCHLITHLFAFDFNDWSTERKRHIFLSAVPRSPSTNWTFEQYNLIIIVLFLSMPGTFWRRS